MAVIKTPERAYNIEYGGRPQLISDCLRGAGLFPDMPCAGRGVCGKCRVKAWGSISPPDGAERSRLTEAELSAGIRLACRASITGGDAEILYSPALPIDCVTEGRGASFPFSPLGKSLGLAVDIGTTTVAAYLYGLSDGRSLGQYAVRNPQTAYGADVISRQQYSLQNGGKALSEAIRACIAGLAGFLTSSAGRSLSDIDAAVITGNTTMLYLLCNEDVSDIAFSPFRAHRLFGEFIAADTLFDGFSHGCSVYIPPCISAYVGADITCAVLSTGMTESPSPVLLADIGTNGELALCSGGRLLCCSTAAGPAFEGAGIECGGSAAAGAIDRVDFIDGRLVSHTVGDAPAVSVCGSGLLDAAAALLDGGFMDESGYLPMKKVFLGGKVFIAQKDIRAFQLAKSAVRAGIDTLLYRAGLEGASPRLYIAGGFGTRLRSESAVKTGLIPRELSASCTAVGNAAGLGASDILLSEGCIERCRTIAAASDVPELASDEKFAELFIERMTFETEE